MVLYSLDSAKSSLERLTIITFIAFCLTEILTVGFGHRKFHEKNQKKDDIHGFEIMFPFFIDQNELAAVVARTT